MTDPAEDWEADHYSPTGWTTVDVFEGTDWPIEILEFQTWLAAQITKIPEEHRGHASLFIMDQDEVYRGIAISYERPKTPEEAAPLTLSQGATEADERAVLAYLKSKYEP